MSVIKALLTLIPENGIIFPVFEAHTASSQLQEFICHCEVDLVG